MNRLTSKLRAQASWFLALTRTLMVIALLVFIWRWVEGPPGPSREEIVDAIESCLNETPPTEANANRCLAARGFPPIDLPLTGPAIDVSPPVGSCAADQTRTIRGWGFPAGQALDIHLFTGPTTSDVIATLPVSAGGAFEIELGQASLPQQCAPGMDYLLQASPGGVGVVAGGPRAVLSVAQRGVFTMTPSEGRCGPVEVRVRATNLGVLEGTVLRLTWGAADPLALVFAELGEATVNAHQGIDTVLTLPAACDVPTAIYAHADGVAGRWKAVYTATGP